MNQGLINVIPTPVLTVSGSKSLISASLISPGEAPPTTCEIIEFLEKKQIILD